MLRMHPSCTAEAICSMHYPQQANDYRTLHPLGKSVVWVYSLKTDSTLIELFLCSFYSRLWGVKSDSNAITDITESESTPESLFDKVFARDIEELLRLTPLWETKLPPQPCTYADALKNETQDKGDINDPQAIWGVKTCATKFIESATKLFGAQNYPLTWNKDNETHLNFVCAAANIRASIFHIDTASKFDIKGFLFILWFLVLIPLSPFFTYSPYDFP